MEKFALISFGNEESYGLLYAAQEFKKYGEIKFFDSEMFDCVNDVVDYKPQYICFSPMTTFYPKAKHIENRIKKHINVVSIYGGHHASNCGYSLGDLTVVGTAYNLDINKRGIVNNGPVEPWHLKQLAREEYYRDIPRMKDRYRKIMLSVTGCPFRCTYCSSSNYKCLEHRDIESIIEEALYIKDSTEEIEWVDDDILFGDKKWLISFLDRWIKDINLPMYVSTTSVNALNTDDAVLCLLRKTVNCIGLGVQAVRSDSLNLLGRSWDTLEQIKQAYNKLVCFGFKVNLQCIIGLPVKDPVEDALDTIRGIKNIAPGSVISCYPLQIYPNTKMEEYCNLKGFKFNHGCNGDTNSGYPAIDFGTKINNRIRNICKLATMIVKYDISMDWLVALLDIYLGDSSKDLSAIRYYECIKDRLPHKVDKIYSSIMSKMNLRY